MLLLGRRLDHWVILVLVEVLLICLDLHARILNMEVHLVAD